MAGRLFRRHIVPLYYFENCWILSQSIVQQLLEDTNIFGLWSFRLYKISRYFSIFRINQQDSMCTMAANNSTGVSFKFSRVVTTFALAFKIPFWITSFSTFPVCCQSISISEISREFDYIVKRFWQSVKHSGFFRVPLRSHSLSKKGVPLPLRSF